MENTEKKKSKVGLIIIIIILLLLILFAVWYFLLRDKKTNEIKENGNNISENKNNDEPKKEEQKERESFEYDYKDGVLTQIVDEEGKAKQTEFIIDGVILVGNRHSYLGLEAETESVISKLAGQGYKKEGINSSFYLNEYIQVYLDTKYEGNEDDVKIFATPHRTVEEYERLSSEDLELLALEKGFVMDYNKPDSNNYKYVNESYINIDYPEGKYDILFIYKGKLTYFITLDLTKEPIDE